MGQMAEFLHKANYGIQDGNFEFDYRDGEINFKCYRNCCGIIPTNEMIHDSIYMPANVFQIYLDGMLQVIFNDLPASEAIALCEGGTTSTQNLHSSQLH